MKRLTFFTISTIAAFLIGCSSESSTSNSWLNKEVVTIKKGELLEITPTNSNKVLASTLEVYNLDNTLNLIDSSFRLTNEEDKFYLNRALELSVAKRVESRNCEVGKVTVDDHGNGVSEDIDVIFENCLVDDITFDGVIHYIRIEDALNLEARVRGLKVTTNDKEAYYESAYIKLDNNNIYEELSGYMKEGQKSAYFKDLHLEIKSFDEKKVYRVDGSLATSCIDNKWIDINTTTAIEKNITLNCPTKGVIEIDGNSSKIEAIYNSNESIDIYLDGNLTKTFNSCEEMEEEVESSCN